MISICIELKSICPKCGNPLPMNALSEKIHCNSCQNDVEFQFDFWRNMILSSAFDAVGTMAEGVGQNQTNMAGGNTFYLMYGSQRPRCGKCKTSIDAAKLADFVASGFAECSKCNNHVSVRGVPAPAANWMDGVKYIVGEDAGMISDGSSADSPAAKSKLIIFTCPSCAGNLEIDGSERTITCKYCSSEIYLPDDLWLRLHPVKTIERWYLVFDEELMMQGLQKWEDINWVAADKDSNLYAISKRGMDNTLFVWSFSPDLKTRWVRTDLKYNISKAGLCATKDGVLVLFDSENNTLMKLSSADGKTLNIITGQAPSPQNPKPFDFSGCTDMIADTDGSIIAMHGNMLHRYSADGSALPLWGPEDHKGGGFFSHLIKSITGDSDSDIDGGSIGVKELASRPVKINAYGIYMQSGLDGCLYFMDNISGEDEMIAKYSKNGDKLGTFKIPLDEKYSKQFIDAAGNIYILGTKPDSDDYVNLLKYNNQTAQWEIGAKDVLEGGTIRDSDLLVGTPDGKLYLFGSDNNLRIFDLSFKLIYISNEAKSDDKDALDDK